MPFVGHGDAVVSSVNQCNTSALPYAMHELEVLLHRVPDKKSYVRGEAWLFDKQIGTLSALHQMPGAVDEFITALKMNDVATRESVRTTLMQSQQWRPGSTSAETQPGSCEPLLSALFYDDRYNETRDRQRLPVYRSLDSFGIPFTVGPSLDDIRRGNVQLSSGAPGDGPAMAQRGGVLRYRPGAKVSWLMKALPSVSARFVFLLDTDTFWLCSATEVVHKRARILAAHKARDDAVLLFAEKGMWPPHQEFHGTHLRLNQSSGYPQENSNAPFRYLNAGAALGRPRDLLALHECMRERYDGFPNACPAGHATDGTLRYYAENNSWQPPVLNRPLHSRDLKYHGLRLKGANWGWEQGCFHMYYLEHINGELPAKCPPIVLDRGGRWLLHLAGVHQHRLEWLSASSQSSRQYPRVRFKDTAERPCVLHTNGPAKKAFKPISAWWQGATQKPTWH